MFLLLPGLSFLFVYIVLAVLPAVLLLVYTYRQDRIEKEPLPLLLKLLMMGVIAGFISSFLERIGTAVLDLTPLTGNAAAYTVVLAFLVVAAVEEGTKFLLLYRHSWKAPSFDYRFDGIVYAVFVSLGFAAIENILYAFTYGPSVLISRALLSVPGHMSFAVAGGIFYGRARQFANTGMQDLKVLNLIAAYVLPVLFHGFYDACVMLNTGLSMLLFALLVVVIYLVIFLAVRREAKKDIPL